MSLRITKGIPIEVRPPTAPSGPSTGMSGASDEATPLADVPNQPSAVIEKVLPISPKLQNHGLWCWAACVEMVRDHYNIPLKQCEIVANATGKNTVSVCNDPNVAGVGCDTDEMDDIWTANGLECEVHLEEPNESGSGQIKFEKLKVEIDANQPVEAGLIWHASGGAGHAIIVKGFGEKDGKRSVWINDPLSPTLLGTLSVIGGEGEILLKELREAFGRGRWVSTWTGLKVKEE